MTRSRAALFDTSVLVPALVEALAEHERAVARLRQAQGGKLELCVATHAIAEVYAVLTTLPLSPRITAGQARELIRVNITSRARVVSLTASDYDVVVDRMTRLGLTGGAIYDGLHVRAAEKIRAAELLTFNARDFRRIPLEYGVKLVVL